MKPKILAILFFTVINSVQIFSQCTLTANCSGGNWSAASTWTPSGCGGLTVPGNNMIIVIPACATVVVDINSPTYSGMTIHVYGSLYFNVGQKINLSANGNVYVHAGGSLDGGNGGSKITIDGSSVWVGPGPDAGPLSFGSSPLPIELLSFTAIAEKASVDLLWSTASELNNDFFTIYRSLDGVEFEQVAVLDGAGSSNNMIVYSFSDNSPYSGISYYRLKQTDFSGNCLYSNMVSVRFSVPEFSYNLFPNPGDGSLLTILFSSAPSEDIKIVVFDAVGKKISSEIIDIIDGSRVEYQLNSLGGLPAGVYFLSVLVQNEERREKVLLCK
jgi:hypothetical protein